MKTRNFFKTLLLLVVMMAGFGFQAQGQYESFFGDSITQYNLAGDEVTYNSLALGGSFMYYPIVNKADTIRMNDKLYYRTDYQLSYLSGCSPYTSYCYSFIREDTTSGQIFLAWQESTPELCVCDMSLSVGDTFWVPSPDYGYSQYVPSIVADSIAYINGRKVIYFHQTELCDNAVYYCDLYNPTLYGQESTVPIMFIESVGPTFGPLGWDYWSGLGCVLLCMYKDGEFVFALDEENLGCEQSAHIAIEENTSLDISIYPNPARRNITVKLDESFTENGLLYVRDATGRVLITQKPKTKNIKINLNGFQSGVYVVTYTEDKKTISKKIIKK